MGARRQVGMPRLLSAVALILPITLVVGVLVTASVVRGQRPAPLLLPVAAAPAADSADCAHLVAALPQELDGGAQGSLDRRELATAVSPGVLPGVAAWGEPPVALYCGLDRPAELTATSRLLDVSGVQFLETPHPTASAWVAVDRPRYVVVLLPPSAGSGPLQQIAEVITETLPARPLDLPR